MTASATADGGNDGALGSAGDVRLEAGFPNPLNDVLDLFGGGAVGHVHNHLRNPFESRAQNKSRDLRSRRWVRTFELSLLS